MRDATVRKTRWWIYIMGVGYIIAGCNHFINPGFYEPIMPPYIPAQLLMIYISGVAEVLCGVFIVPTKTRKLAAWALILLLVAIFPANIQMAINYVKRDDPNFWIALARLPLQLPLIWAAWKCT